MSAGGKRPGAGRPKKPAAEKIAEGNAGRREITTVQFNGDVCEVPAAPNFLKQKSREDNGEIPSATEIYNLTWEYINRSDCSELIPPSLVEDFANVRRSFLECESINRRVGRIIKGKKSPYVGMALEYLRESRNYFNMIWEIISVNNQSAVGGNNEFLELLTKRGF